jgi:deoxyribodipyrimidine photo-lyase
VDIVWLRDDFRLDNQPPLAAAAGRPALCVYVHDQRPQNGRPLGGAAKWRLAQSLSQFERALSARGARLDIVEGKAEEAILALASASGARRVLWSRRYEAAAASLDAAVEAALIARGVEAQNFNGRLMREPKEVAKAGAFGSFSAFWRRCRGLGPLPEPLAAPRRLESAPWPAEAPQRTTIAALRLTPV